MKKIIFDGSMGAAGDMLAGALLDLFDDPESVVNDINTLIREAGLDNVITEVVNKMRDKTEGLQFDVEVDGQRELPEDFDDRERWDPEYRREDHRFDGYHERPGHFHPDDYRHHDHYNPHRHHSRPEHHRHEDHDHYRPHHQHRHEHFRDDDYRRYPHHHPEHEPGDRRPHARLPHREDFHEHRHSPDDRRPHFEKPECRHDRPSGEWCCPPLPHLCDGPIEIHFHLHIGENVFAKPERKKHHHHHHHHGKKAKHRVHEAPSGSQIPPEKKEPKAKPKKSPAMRTSKDHFC